MADIRIIGAATLEIGDRLIPQDEIRGRKVDLEFRRVRGKANQLVKISMDGINQLAFLVDEDKTNRKVLVLQSGLVVDLID